MDTSPHHPPNSAVALFHRAASRIGALLAAAGPAPRRARPGAPPIAPERAGGDGPRGAAEAALQRAAEAMQAGDDEAVDRADRYCRLAERLAKASREVAAMPAAETSAPIDDAEALRLELARRLDRLAAAAARPDPDEA